MIQRLESAQNLLRASSDERNDVARTDEAVSVDKPDDFVVTVGYPQRCGMGRAFEAGKAG